MKMRLLLYSFFCGIVCINSTVHAWKFWEWSQSSVDYAQLQSDVKDELDRVVFNKLEYVSQEMMLARYKLSKGIVDHVRECKYDSQEDARAQAIAAVKPAIKHFIVDLGAEKVRQEIGMYYSGRPPYNPQQFEQRVKEELANQVDDAFRKNKDVTPFLKLAALKEIIKQFDKNYGVQAGGAPASSSNTGLYPNLDKPSSQNYTAQLPAGVDQPAGAPSDNIHELYPQFNEKTKEGLERNEKFFGPFFEKVKQFRANECPVCKEDFDVQRARVNLFCGHSLCATCLAGHIHINEKRDCPTCRQEIRKEEFSAQFLRKFINSVELKHLFPRMHEKIRRLFGF